MEVGDKNGGMRKVVGGFPSGLIVANPLYKIFEFAVSSAGVEYFVDFPLNFPFNFDGQWIGIYLAREGIC